MAEARLVGRELLSGRCWRRACRQGRVGSQAWSVWFPVFQGPRSCCDVAAEAGDPLSLGGGGASCLKGVHVVWARPSLEGAGADGAPPGLSPHSGLAGVLTQNPPQNQEGQLRPVWGPRLANRVVTACEFLSHSPNKVTPASMQGPSREGIYCCIKPPAENPLPTLGDSDPHSGRRGQPWGSGENPTLALATPRPCPVHAGHGDGAPGRHHGASEPSPPSRACSVLPWTPECLPPAAEPGPHL